MVLIDLEKSWFLAFGQPDFFFQSVKGRDYAIFIAKINLYIS